MTKFRHLFDAKDEEIGPLCLVLFCFVIFDSNKFSNILTKSEGET